MDAKRERERELNNSRPGKQKAAVKEAAWTTVDELHPPISLPTSGYGLH